MSFGKVFLKTHKQTKITRKNLKECYQKKTYNVTKKKLNILIKRAKIDNRDKFDKALELQAKMLAIRT